MDPYKVKQLIRERVRFEPKAFWLQVLQRSTEASWYAEQARTLSWDLNSSVAVKSNRTKATPPQ